MEYSEIEQAVRDARVLDDIKVVTFPFTEKRGLAFCVTGTAESSGNRFELAIGFKSNFPVSFPVLFLLNKGDFKDIPHVENDGYICYAKDDDIVLNIDNPVGIIHDGFEMAMTTLHDGISGTNIDDFYNEYTVYWERLGNLDRVLTNIAESDLVTAIHFRNFNKKNLIYAESCGAKKIKNFENIFEAAKNPAPVYQGIYIPLEPSSKIWIPFKETTLTNEMLKELVAGNLSEVNEARLQSILKTTKMEDLLIFRLPQPNGYSCLFGVRIKKIYHQRHPLIDLSTKAAIVPVGVTQIDADYLLVRGGTGQNFTDKKVLVIGAGSVGGYICDELVKTAIVNVDVVDKDILFPENCYRHSCGFIYVFENKAIAIKKKLESFYPHSNVRAYKSSIEKVLQEGEIVLKDYDAIIVATGNASLNQHLNRMFMKEIPGIPVLYSWLDPYGIGGHCLITNLLDKGCYQCLYNNAGLHNIASFADPNQPKGFSKHISGCGSSYVPYGSLDSMHTALLTVSRLTDVFTGKENKNAISSWKGNADLFLAAGYNLSPRFQQASNQLEASRYHFSQPNCNICGSK
jgi:hypothetical protein